MWCFCDVFLPSGAGRRPFSFLHVEKTRSAYTHAEFAYASRGMPPALTRRPVCTRPGALDRRAATERSWGCSLWILRPILTFRGTPQTATLPWCVRAHMSLACLHASAHVRTPSDHSTPYLVPICVPHRTTVPYMRPACLHASEHVRARMNSCLHTQSCTVGAPMHAYADVLTRGRATYAPLLL